MEPFLVMLKKLEDPNIVIIGVADKSSRIIDSSFYISSKTLSLAVDIFLYSLLLAIFLIIFIELISQALHSEYQISHYLHSKILGDLPLIKNPLPGAKDERKLLDIASIASYYEFRRIFLALFPKDQPIDEYSLLFMSSKNHEGKSLISSTFAVTLAREKRAKVLIIDFHWQDPSVHKFYKTKQDILIDDYLSKLEKPMELVRNSSVEGVDVISAPIVDLKKNIWKDFNQGDFERMFKKLHNEYPFIIIDSAPLFPSKKHIIDPIKIAAVTTNVVLVLLTKKIRKKFIKAAKINIEEVTKNLIGLIVNNRYNTLRKQS
jgi:Mrp family chromosome partitioning ATPase